MKKIFALMLAVLMLVTLAACGDNGGAGGNGGNGGSEKYAEALQSFMEAYYGVDTSKLQPSAPASIWEDNPYLINDASWLAESNHEEMAYLAGENFTVTVKNASKTDVTGDALESLKAAFAQQKGIDAGECKAFAVVSASVEIAGDLGSDTVSIEAKMAKIGDTWYVAEWYDYDGGYYVMFKVETMVGG